MEIDSALWTGRWRQPCKPCKGTGKAEYLGRITYPGGTWMDKWSACKICDGTGERNDG